MIAAAEKTPYQWTGVEEVGVKTDARSGRIVVDAAYHTNIPNIYAIGDLIDGPMLAHKASSEACAAVDGLAGLYSEVNYDAIPSVVYTWPEAASVDRRKSSLKNAGSRITQAIFLLAELDALCAWGKKKGLSKF